MDSGNTTGLESFRTNHEQPQVDTLSITSFRTDRVSEGKTSVGARSSTTFRSYAYGCGALPGCNAYFNNFSVVWQYIRLKLGRSAFYNKFPFGCDMQKGNQRW